MNEREEIRGRLSTLEQRLANWIGRNVDRSRVAVRIVDPSLIISTAMGTRSENQDRIASLNGETLAGEKFSAVVLCDGIGGLADGGACADAAIAALASAIFNSTRRRIDETIFNAVLHANDVVSKAYSGRGGATLSLVVMNANRQIYCANIGDSRIYIRSSAGALDQITIDDTLAGQLANLPSGEEADSNRPELKHLLQFIGMGRGISVRVQEIDMLDLQLVVLTSDGAHGIGHVLMEKLLKGSGSPSTFARRMLAVSEWIGVADNASVAIWNATQSTRVATGRNGDMRSLQITDPWETIEFCFADSSVRTVSLLDSRNAVTKKTRRSKRPTAKLKSVDFAEPADGGKVIDDNEADKPTVRLTFGPDLLADSKESGAGVQGADAKISEIAQSTEPAPMSVSVETDIR